MAGASARSDLLRPGTGRRIVNTNEVAVESAGARGPAPAGRL